MRRPKPSQWGQTGWFNTTSLVSALLGILAVVGGGSIINLKIGALRKDVEKARAEAQIAAVNNTTTSSSTTTGQPATTDPLRDRLADVFKSDPSIGTGWKITADRTGEQTAKIEVTCGRSQPDLRAFVGLFATIDGSDGAIAPYVRPVAGVSTCAPGTVVSFDTTLPPCFKGDVEVLLTIPPERLRADFDELDRVLSSPARPLIPNGVVQVNVVGPDGSRSGLAVQLASGNGEIKPPAGCLFENP
jgi:hypothetical protein